jgi:hypothetical protein
LGKEGKRFLRWAFRQSIVGSRQSGVRSHVQKSARTVESDNSDTPSLILLKPRNALLLNKEPSLSLSPYILLRIDPVYSLTYNFFDATLNKGVITDADRKGKVMSFPFSCIAIFESLCIQVVLKRISSGSGGKNGRRGILAFIQVMLDKSKMGIINNLYEGTVFCVVRHCGIPLFNDSRRKKFPRTVNGIH